MRDFKKAMTVIIEAESHDEAAKKMQDSPHFKMMPGGWIEVMEVGEM